MLPPRHVEVDAAQHLQAQVRLLQALHVIVILINLAVPQAVEKRAIRSASVSRARSLSIHCFPE